MAVSRISLFALTGSLAALASVIQAGTVPPPAATADKCPAPAEAVVLAAQSNVSPAPSGTLPAETAMQPAPKLTVTGRDSLAAPVCPPPPPAPNSQKITKSRSNIQNN